LKGFAVKGARRNRVTPRLRFSRCAPSALRAQLPLSRQLRLIAKRTEWQLPRQSGFARTEAVADAHRYMQLTQCENQNLKFVHENQKISTLSLVCVA